MGSKATAIFGGSFNPPGLHHRHIAAEVREAVGRVTMVPYGPRPDKPSTDGVDPVHRAAMADLAFGNLDGVEVDLFDLEEPTFTRTHALEQKYAGLGIGEVWHVVGADKVAGGRRGTLGHPAPVGARDGFVEVVTLHHDAPAG
jgi:nicotinic acid mononucleotide adenylyltransferase